MKADKIYFDSFGILWLGWSQGSGLTTVGNLSILSNVKDLGKYEPYVCGKIIESTKELRVVRKKDTEYATIRLYRIPVYGKKADRYLDEKYDIFGGEIQPTSFTYMSWTIEGKNIIVHTFGSYAEAKGFHEF